MKKLKLMATGLAASFSLFAQNKPNIIYILADDLGYGDLKCLNENSQIPTPNFDKLSSEGMHFTDAHSNSSVSTPTRYGILTGRYCFRSSLKKNVLNGYSAPLIEKDRETVGSVLQKSGYETAIFGKWHLGLGWAKKEGAVNDNEKSKVQSNEKTTDFSAKLTDTPNDHGFDYSYIIPASLDMDPYVYIENRKVVNPTVNAIEGTNSIRGVMWRKGLASSDFEFPKTMENFTDKAISYISDYKSDKPLFVYLPLPAPHTPWVTNEKFLGKSGAGLYGDYVCQVDDEIGKILAAIDKKGWKENTLVIITSDNGADWNEKDKKAFPKHQVNYIYKGEKSDVWDGGHRVPFLVRWPKVIKAGSVSDHTVCLTDFTATAADITNQKLNKGVAEDSKSMLPIFKGKATRSNTRKEVVHHSIGGMFALRQGKWKFVDGEGSGGWTKLAVIDTSKVQLYDMKNDPTEKTNVYDKYPNIVKKLKKRLEEIKINK